MENKQDTIDLKEFLGKENSDEVLYQKSRKLEVYLEQRVKNDRDILLNAINSGSLDASDAKLARYEINSEMSEQLMHELLYFYRYMASILVFTFLDKERAWRFIQDMANAFFETSNLDMDKMEERTKIINEINSKARIWDNFRLGDKTPANDLMWKFSEEINGKFWPESKKSLLLMMYLQNISTQALVSFRIKDLLA